MITERKQIRAVTARHVILKHRNIEFRHWKSEKIPHFCGSERQVQTKWDTS